MCSEIFCKLFARNYCVLKYKVCERRLNTQDKEQNKQKEKKPGRNRNETGKH